MTSSKYDEMMTRKNFLPLKLEGLTEELKVRASKELNESEETTSRCIRELQARVFAIRHLIPKTDDAFFLQFLRARKFDIEKSFTLMMEFYKVKRSYKDVFIDFDCERNSSLMKEGRCAFLPYRNYDGTAVIMFKVANWDPIEHDVITVVRHYCCSVLYLNEIPATQVCGLQVIYDFKGTELRHVRAFTPHYLKLLSKGFRDAFPLRLKGLHFCNESFIVRYMWTIMRLLLKEKIVNRVHFHGKSTESLHKYISKEILPEMYGGDNKSKNISEWSSREVESYYPAYVALTRTGFTAAYQGSYRNSVDIKKTNGSVLAK